MTAKTKKNTKKVPYWQMSGKKTLFRGASYTRNPKSVLCLAGHLKSGMSYKAVYNIRSGNQVSRGFLGFWQVSGSGWIWLDLASWKTGFWVPAVWLHCCTLPAVWLDCCSFLLSGLTVLLLYGCTCARHCGCLDACMAVLLHVTCCMAVLLHVTCCMA